jgi:uncharacterized protein YecE (DUF72 family)
MSDSTPPLFDAVPRHRADLLAAVGQLAREGIFLGTSSWKYPGWQGRLYDRERYVWKGKYSEDRFERLCLAEYAECFPTVCVDAAYYQFPTARWLDELSSMVPPEFLFAFKVTDEVTIRRFPNLPRFGRRAGQLNPGFLQPDRFIRDFLGPCEAMRNQVSLLIFEFSKFYAEDFARGRDFVAALDAFLAALPPGWPYGVEIRNRTYLAPEYFAMLSRHRVTHVFNSWQDMPPIDEQLRLPEAVTHPGLVAARLLLRPGRKYEEAVKQFSPYREIKDPYPEGQQAGADLVQSHRRQRAGGKTFIYVNNRFEGNALQTIEGIIQRANRAAPPP